MSAKNVRLYSCFLVLLLGAYALLLACPTPWAHSTGGVFGSHEQAILNHADPRVYLELQDGDSWTNDIGSFQRQKDKDGYRVIYRWQDYMGGKRELELQITEQALKKSEDAFGITASSRKAFYENHFSRYLKKDTGVLKIVQAIKQKRGPVHFSGYRVVDHKDYQHFLDICTKFESDYLKSKGFHFYKKQRLEIDYGATVKSQMPLMEGTARRFLEVAKANQMTFSLLVHMIMSFVQYIEYDVPPVTLDGRYLMGLWPPLETLVRGKGDCDTKAVLFSSISNNFVGLKTVIVRIPGHAFNGLVGVHKRYPKDTIMKYNGQDVLLLDLTGLNNFGDLGAIHESDRQELRVRFPVVYETK